MATLIFEKPRGKDQPLPLEINAETFISVKGFKASGNQLTDKKIKLIETSICYVGSLCGWYDISRLYDKPTIILASDIEAYKKSALGFSLGEGQYMYTPDDHLTW